MISEAAGEVSLCHYSRYSHVPMPLSLRDELPMLAFSSLAESPVIVDVDGDREKVLARGPRWVSLSSGAMSVLVR